MIGPRAGADDRTGPGPRPGRGGRRGRWPLGLFGMIGLLGVTEPLAARFEADRLSMGAWSWKVGGAASRGEAVGADLLCFGDSLNSVGLAPRVVEARTG